MKTLKFTDELVHKVLNGERTKTWRLWDDKNLQIGDVVLFVKGEDRIPFAKAKLTNVVEKRFDQIDKSDLVGHQEDFNRIYKTASRFYNRLVTDDTPTKIISFEILKKLL